MFNFNLLLARLESAEPLNGPQNLDKHSGCFMVIRWPISKLIIDVKGQHAT